MTKPPKLNPLWSLKGPVAQACTKLGFPYKPRAEQQEFAELISEALRRQKEGQAGIVPIEAGTGTGKTLAYLIPGALQAAKLGEKMLVSTHTIALGLQILHQDGRIAQEVVQKLTGKRLSIAHLRGRRHFVSPSRAMAMANLAHEDGYPASEWQPYREIAVKTKEALKTARIYLQQGTIDNGVQDLVESSLLDWIEEGSDNIIKREHICLTPGSPEDELAIYKLSRHAAFAADILVTTHAYTALTLARKHLANILEQSYNSIVIDEADQWASAAASVSFVQLALSSIQSSINEVNEASRHVKDKIKIAEVSKKALKWVDNLQTLAPADKDATVNIADKGPEIAAIGTLLGHLRDLQKMAAKHKDYTASAAGNLSRVEQELGFMLDLAEQPLWQTHWRTSRVEGLPSLEAVSKFPGRIMKRMWTTDNAPLAKTIILTSATLATPGYGERERWYAIERATGIGRDNAMLDLAKQIRLKKFGTLRFRFADPAAPIANVGADSVLSPEAVAYTVQVIKAARKESATRKGRTLVLVPSYKDIAQLAPYLGKGVLIHEPGVPLQEMLRLYRDTPECCLITPGAWSGANLPGLIQNLVITRIPYPQHEDNNKADINGHALRLLRQGIGRAIRKEDDDATVWFCDPRMPIPECITEEARLLPRPGYTILLSAIDKRFKDEFGVKEDAAKIGVFYKPGPKPTKGRASRVAEELAIG